MESTEESKSSKLEEIPKEIVNIKWTNQNFVVEIESEMSILGLKRKLFQLTNVQPGRQKLLGIPKYKGPLANDDVLLKELEIKPATKVMMMGTVDEKHLVVPDLNEGEICNDLDVDYHKEVKKIADSEENQKKLQNRIKSISVELRSPPRKGKKCLVLDIDYTLFDHRSVAERPIELMRPYLHEFLSACYKEYDIVLWSATSMKWIDVKMTELGVYKNPNYAVTFALSSSAMFSITTYNKDEKRIHDVKALGVIWGRFPEHYSPANTIHLDDLSRNFAMNPQKNGLKIRPFKKAHMSRTTDKELLALTQYLLLIAKLDDFSKLDHSQWEDYVVARESELTFL